MKNRIFILFCFSVLSFISCKKETVITSTNSNLTITKTIEANQWQFANNNNSYFVNIQDARINKTTLDNDDISVSIMQGASNFYEQLPFVYDNISFSYTVGVGQVQINYQNLNFQQPPIAPLKMIVKIVLIRSTQ